MKVRLDFVTNSSSSSYVCCICGAEETNWDIPDWIAYCDNEHYFCKDHVEGDFFNLNHNHMVEDEEQCPVCSFRAYADYEMASYLLKTRHIPRDEVFAEIKKANKRRRKLYDNEYIQYVMSKFDLTEDIVMNEIRNKFNTWEEYVGYRG